MVYNIFMLHIYVDCWLFKQGLAFHRVLPFSKDQAKGT